MIVPINKGASPFAPSPALPSQTNLLMALATMHAQGRFNDDSDDDKRSHHSATVLPFPK